MKKRIRQAITFLMVLMCSLTTVFSWTDYTQHKTSSFSTRQGKQQVSLRKWNENHEPLTGAVFELYRIENGTEYKIGDSFMSDDHGEIDVYHLNVGKYYFLEIQPPEGYEFLKDDEGCDIRKHFFEVSDDNGDVLFLDVYNKTKESTLVLNKSVINEDGSELSSNQRSTEFVFNVFFEGLEEFTYVKNQNTYVSPNGGEVRLKHGEELSIVNLPIGIKYEIYEKDYENYQVEAVNNVGVLDADNVVSFVNYRLIQENVLSLTKRLHLQEDSILNQQEAFEFVFNFSEEGPYTYRLNQGKTREMKSGDSVFLKNEDTIEIFGIGKNVDYEIEERLDSSHLEADKSTIKGVFKEENKHEYVVNNVEVGFEKEGHLRIHKKVLYSEIEDDFSFQIYLDTDEKVEYSTDGQNWYPYKKESVLSFNSENILTLKGIPIGTQYEVFEIPQEGYEGQIKSYRGTLVEPTQDLIFVNEKTEDYSGKVIVSKCVENIDTDRLFDFTLRVDGKEEKFSLRNGEAKEFILPEGSEYLVREDDYKDEGYRTKIRNASGIVGKDDIFVEVTNVYDSSLVKKEIKGEKIWRNVENVLLPDSIVIDLYGDNRLVASQKVYPDEQNRWLYIFKMPGFNEKNEEIEYVVKEQKVEGFITTYEDTNIINTYYDPIVVELGIEKQVVNKTDVKVDDLFHFKIRSLYGEPLPKQNILKINGEGEAFFDVIKLSQPGTYHYQISEIKEDDSRYIYDDKPVFVDVVVEGNGFELELVKLEYRKEGYESLEQALFENVRQPDIDESLDQSPIDDEHNETSDNSSSHPNYQSAVEKKETEVSSPTIPPTGQGLPLKVLVGIIFIVFSLFLWLMQRKESRKNK